MDRYQPIINTYNLEHFNKIHHCKVLVVGAGGIGCEILKNLALTGFRYADLIDLDTIDVSNLNRQFLFRPEHVGQPKAIVAAQAAQRFNPDMKVTAYHANIKEARFNAAYISQFSVVLNALDNVDARRHVNRLCLSAKVPLLDSGTTGFLGQVTPIIKDRSACYECFPKPTQKVYPICTIRSTPEKPVHCIVWGKECFKLIFGATEDSMLFEDSESTGDESTYMHLLRPYPLASSESRYHDDATMEAVLKYGSNLLNALYGKDIKKRIDMEVYKTAKIAPQPICEDSVSDAVAIAKNIFLREHSLKHGNNSDENKQCCLPSQLPGWDQNVFSLRDNLVEFIVCIMQLPDPSLLGKLVFDKDDLWCMRFVAAAANIRSFVFSIEQLSFHDTKGVAGNIIPAIATTNAIVAGIQVMQAVKVIEAADSLFEPPIEEDSNASCSSKNDMIRRVCPNVYCLRLPTRKGLYLQPSSVEKPVPSCFVCGSAQLSLQVDVNTFTLANLVNKVLKGKLSCNEPSIMVEATFIYEEGEDADEDLQDNLSLTLAGCPGGGIHDGAVVAVDDYSQDLQFQLLVKHISQSELENSEDENTVSDLFILSGAKTLQEKQAASASTEGKTASSTDLDIDDVVLLVGSETNGGKNADRNGDVGSYADATEAGEKRKRD